MICLRQKYGSDRLNDHLWEIPQTGAMLVPGRVYANAKMISALAFEVEPALDDVMRRPPRLPRITNRRATGGNPCGSIRSSADEWLKKLPTVVKSNINPEFQKRRDRPHHRAAYIRGCREAILRCVRSIGVSFDHVEEFLPVFDLSVWNSVVAAISLVDHEILDHR